MLFCDEVWLWARNDSTTLFHSWMDDNRFLHCGALPVESHWAGGVLGPRLRSSAVWGISQRTATLARGSGVSIWVNEESRRSLGSKCLWLNLMLANCLDIQRGNICWYLQCDIFMCWTWTRNYFLYSIFVLCCPNGNFSHGEFGSLFSRKASCNSHATQPKLIMKCMLGLFTFP